MDNKLKQFLAVTFFNILLCTAAVAVNVRTVRGMWIAIIWWIVCMFAGTVISGDRNDEYSTSAILNLTTVVFFSSSMVWWLINLIPG